VAIGTPTSLGTPTTGTGLTLNLVTNTVAPSGALIIAVGFWGHSSDKTGTMSGGGLTWTTDHTNTYVFGYTFRVGIFSAPAPSGLASSSTLTLTINAAHDGTMLSAFYCTGLDQSGTREDISTGTGAATAAWSSGSATTTNANDLIIGGSLIDSATTSTATGSATELADWQLAGNSWSATSAYRIESSTGSKSLTGTWGAAANHVAAFAAYKEAAGAGATAPVFQRRTSPLRYPQLRR
jgi:hypothetical protein